MLTHGGFEISLRAFIREYKTALGVNQGSSEFEHVLSQVKRYEAGDGAGRVNAVYSAYTDALSSTDIDLRGSLTNVLDGSTVTFPIVMGIFVVNLSETAGEYITVGGSTNPFSTWLSASGDGVRVYRKGGFLALWNPWDGYATTASTGDILTLAPAAGAPACAYMIVGRTA